MSLYSSQTISGYNSSPPSDDGAAESQNQATWSGVKTKLGDPVKTLAEAINTQLVTAFASVGLEKIGSGTVSAQASLEILDMTSDYSAYLILLDNIVPATDATTLALRVSTDNSTFITSTVYDYAATVPISGSATSSLDAGGSAANSIALANLRGTAAGEESTAWVLCHDPSDANKHTLFSYMVHGVSSASQFTTYVGGGKYAADTAVQGVQFLMSSGNISLNYVVFGLIA